MKHGLVAALAAFSLPAQAQMVTITPQQIGEIFCTGSLGNDMAPIVALATPDLARSIDTAMAQNTARIAAAPDDKPPLGDGLPWRSWTDYADQCSVGETTMLADQARVEIIYAFSEAPDAAYRNSLMLSPVAVEAGLPPFWRVDDIDLGDGTMRGALLDAFLP